MKNYRQGSGRGSRDLERGQQPTRRGRGPHYYVEEAVDLRKPKSTLKHCLNDIHNYFALRKTEHKLSACPDAYCRTYMLFKISSVFLISKHEIEEISHRKLLIHISHAWSELITSEEQTNGDGFT